MISEYLSCTATLVSALIIFRASSEDLMARSETTVSTESWLSTIPFKSEAGVWFVIPSMSVGALSDEYLRDDQSKSHNMEERRRTSARL